jgi:predicted phosphodiesterase
VSNVLWDVFLFIFLLAGIARLIIRGLLPLLAVLSDCDWDEVIGPFIWVLGGILVLGVVVGPPLVWLATVLDWVDGDSIVWKLRRDSFISLRSFLEIGALWTVLAVGYAALLSSTRPLVRFLALSLARITALYGQILVAVYALVLLQGGYYLQLYFFNLMPTDWFGQGILGSSTRAVYFLNNILDAIPTAICTLVLLAAAAALIRAPVRWVTIGVRLTHQLYRYYYPWELWRRSRLWPESGYDVALDTAKRVDLLLASDLHVTDPGGETLEPRPKTPLSHNPLDLVREISARTRPAAMLVTGDLTDTGTDLQWRRVRIGLSGPYELVLLPGNHDYHFRHVAARFNVRGLISALMENGSFTPDEIEKRIKRIVSSQGRFPMLFRSERIPLDVLTLDSNLRPSGWPVTNAVGQVGKPQLATARELLQDRDRSRVLIVALHHHIIPPPFTLNAPFLLCLDREEVLSLALAAGAAAIVHGHTHQPFVYRHPKGLLIISCGSATFTAKGRFATEIGTPSCYGIQIEGASITAVTLYRVEPRKHKPRKRAVLLERLRSCIPDAY